MQKPIYITFASVKGGIGRTTLTILLASYLHYKKGYHVAVVDCCYPGYSIDLLRQQEIDRIEEDSHYLGKARRQFTAMQKKAYPIINTQAVAAMEAANSLQEVDVVLFDIPNLMESAGTVELLTVMDAVLFPITNGSMAINTLQRFLEVMNLHVITTGKSRIKSMHLLRNMTNNWDGEAFHATCREIAEEAGISLLNAVLPYSKHFRKDLLYAPGSEVCVSTLFPFDTSFTAMVGGAMNEVEQVIVGLCGKN